jgi:hypothetical protein
MNTSSMLKHLETCDKVALASWNLKNTIWLNYLNKLNRRKGITYFPGKEEFLKQSTGWELSRHPYSQPRFRLVYIVSSGIYKFWQYWIVEREAQRKKGENKAERTATPLSLTTNIVFAFYVFALSCGLAGFVFLVEVLILGCKKVWLKLKTQDVSYHGRIFKQVNKIRENANLARIISIPKCLKRIP